VHSDLTPASLRRSLPGYFQWRAQSFRVVGICKGPVLAKTKPGAPTRSFTDRALVGLGRSRHATRTHPAPRHRAAATCHRWCLVSPIWRANLPGWFVLKHSQKILPGSPVPPEAIAKPAMPSSCSHCSGRKQGRLSVVPIAIGHPHSATGRRPISQATYYCHYLCGQTPANTVYFRDFSFQSDFWREAWAEEDFGRRSFMRSGGSMRAEFFFRPFAVVAPVNVGRLHGEFEQNVAIAFMDSMSPAPTNNVFSLLRLAGRPRAKFGNNNCHWLKPDFIEAMFFARGGCAGRKMAMAQIVMGKGRFFSVRTEFARRGRPDASAFANSFGQLLQKRVQLVASSSAVA